MFQEVSLYFLLLAMIAEITGTIGGFGSSVFFVPIASFFFDFQSVLGLTAIFHLSSNISKIALFRKGLNKKLLINILLIFLQLLLDFLNSFYFFYIILLHSKLTDSNAILLKRQTQHH